MWTITFCFLFSQISATADEVFQDASRALSGIEGLDLIETDAGGLELTGGVLRLEDLAQVESFTSRHPEVLRKYRIHSAVQTPIRVNTPKRSVFLELALVEVRKSAFEKLGLRIKPIISGFANLTFDFGSSKSSQTTVGSWDPIRAFLDIALQSGDAHIHAKQSLVTDEGEFGTFFAGGEFPIRLVSEKSASVEFKEFGLKLEFKPKILNSKRVHLVIRARLSELDMGSMVEGLPVISTKVLNNQISAPLNQMMAIGGLVRSNQSQFSDKIPGIASVPILGRLFQSKDFKRHQSEAYIFITPKIMDQPWTPSPEL